MTIYVESTVDGTASQSTFSTLAAFATSARSLMRNPGRSIALDISEQLWPDFPSSDITRESSTTSLAEWRNVVLPAMDPGEPDNDDGACELRCLFMGGDATRTLNVYLRPDRIPVQPISVVRTRRNYNVGEDRHHSVVDNYPARSSHVLRRGRLEQGA
ncbi:hypothetical protein BDZ89DRAFT_546553 [Hymenopellis radicata]|nr:hypothetical protein BDZ89DRAFT_546553 [Hymenopellis radicata]